MASQPEAGSKAPSFDLPTDEGSISLASLKANPVILYFYPRDDTPGCTNEAKDFTALKAEFDALGAVIIGVSKDTPEKHAKFRAKHDLAVTLASDESGETLEAYGVWVEKNMYGKKSMGIQRATFLIDGDGVIRRTWPKVKVAGHAEDVLAATKEL